MGAETLSFQAEVARLLHIVTHSLYTNKEIFLRELVSNASDACDKLRYLAQTNADLLADDPDLRIRIELDKDAKTLCVIDNGIGMNREDMVQNLGTIARSGTAAFAENMSGDAAKDTRLIGQFGVGFYSAFMVADRVAVTSRRAGEAEAWTWTSEGTGSFTIEQAGESPRGTRIVLHLKDSEAEFLEKIRIERIIKTYSDHVALPIVVAVGGEEETVNTGSAIWSRAKSLISEQQYKEFYHHVGHAFDDPWLTIHHKAEGKIEYTMLLFVPTEKPFDLFEPDRKHKVKLYVRRVFVTDSCEGLVPSWLRFLKGVVDSEDLPLNISRETLQDNPIVRMIRSGVVRKVLGDLEAKAKDEPEAYAKFWETFGAVLKEGLYEDFENRDRLMKLARFRTTASDKLVSLAEYVERMKDGQDAIYYMTGDDLSKLSKSPQLEGFKAKGIEVLLMTDPVDDFWLNMSPPFEGKALKSVTRGDIDLSAVKGEEKTEAEKPEAAKEDDLAALINAFKASLGGLVKDVRASDRLTGSPVCLVAAEGDMDMRLARLLRQARPGEAANAPRILEVNPRHALIRKLAGLARSDAASVSDSAHLLLDQARIVEGDSPVDLEAFVRRLNAAVDQGLPAA